MEKQLNLIVVMSKIDKLIVSIYVYKTIVSFH